MLCALSLLVLSQATIADVPQINATGGTQRIQHSGGSDPQVFDEVKWIVVNPLNVQGAIVQLECAPFVHVVDTASQVDARLDLRVLRSNRNADWRVTIPSDETDLSSGGRTAVVTAAASGEGVGQLGIVVTFDSRGAALLTEGDYETTLIGTITAN